MQVFLSDNIYIRLHCLTARKNQGKRVSLTTPHDVPASKFIDRLAKYLRENVDEVQPLPWATFAKTGNHVEKQPQNPNWWYTEAHLYFVKFTFTDQSV